MAYIGPGIVDIDQQQTAAERSSGRAAGVRHEETRR